MDDHFCGYYLEGVDHLGRLVDGHLRVIRMELVRVTLVDTKGPLISRSVLLTSG